MGGRKELEPCRAKTMMYFHCVFSVYNSIYNIVDIKQNLPSD